MDWMIRPGGIKVMWEESDKIWIASKDKVSPTGSGMAFGYGDTEKEAIEDLLGWMEEMEDLEL